MFLLNILELGLFGTLKHVITVVNVMKCVEFGFVIAGEKHCTNPSAEEEAVTMQMSYCHANEGMLIHLNISVLTLNCEKNLTLDCKLIPLHHIKNSKPSFN